MPKNLRQTVRFAKTPPGKLYAALMDDRTHGKISGGRARIGKKPGSRFSACDGWIRGVTLSLEKGRRIVQAWRGADWPEGAWSIAVFDFAPKGKGAVLTFSQFGVPDRKYKGIVKGWKDFYWDPMKELFGEK